MLIAIISNTIISVHRNCDFIVRINIVYFLFMDEVDKCYLITIQGMKEWLMRKVVRLLKF